MDWPGCDVLLAIHNVHLCRPLVQPETERESFGIRRPNSTQPKSKAVRNLIGQTRPCNGILLVHVLFMFGTRTLCTKCCENWIKGWEVWPLCHTWDTKLGLGNIAHWLSDWLLQQVYSVASH